MKILCVAHDFALAGAQMSLLRLIRRLHTQYSIPIEVLALGDGCMRPQYETLAPVSIIDIQNFDKQELVKRINSFLQKLSFVPEVILGNTIVAPKIYPYLSSLNIPIVTRVAELEASVARYGTEETLYNLVHYSSHFVAVSPPVAEMLIRRDVDKKAITCLPGVIEKVLPFNNTARKELLERFNIPQDVPIVWGGGSISSRKGADLFYLLARKLVQQGIKNFHAIWVGDNENSLVHVLFAGRAEKHITFVGPVADPASLMTPGDTFVLSSREDPFPLIALEAGAQGIALAGFWGNGGMAPVIQEARGILAPMEDVSALAAGIAPLLESPEKSIELGLQTKQVIMKSYTMDQVAPQWVQFLNSIAHTKPTSPYSMELHNNQKPNHFFSLKKNNPSITAIIRTVGERTQHLCHSLLSKYLPDENIICVQERPFSKALHESFVKGIASKEEWVLVLDADVLIAPDFIASALDMLQAAPSELFVLQGLVCDKFFGILRPAGNHIYRTSLLEQAISCIPEEGTSLRPESDTISAMVKKGYVFWQKPLIAGLHDFEQYDYDVAKKCFLQAHKHRDYLPAILKTWHTLAEQDTDFQVAYEAARAGLRYKGTVFVDAQFLQDKIGHIPMPANKQGREALLAEYSPDKIKKMIVEFTRQALGSEMQKNMFPAQRWDVVYK